MEEKKVSISLKELNELNALSCEYERLQNELDDWLQRVKDRLPADWDLPFIIEKERDEEREKLVKFLSK